MNATTTFTLPETMRLLWSRKGLIVGCALLGAALAFALCFAITPRYRAEGNLVVRSEAITAPETDAAFNSTAVNEAVVTTEQDVLTSRGLLERVARTVDIPPKMLEQWSLSGVLVSVIRSVASLGGPGALAWTDTQLATLFPPEPDNAITELNKRVNFIDNSLTLATAKGSSVINVKATTADAQLSTDIVNSLLKIYMQDRVAEQTRTARLISEALREREGKTRAQIAEAEDRLTSALGEPGALETNEVPALMREMTLLGARLTDAQAELARRQSDYNSALQYRRATRGNPIAFADSIAGGRIPQLRQQYDNAQQQLARLPEDLRPNYPAKLALRRELAQLQTQISAEAKRVLEQRRSDMLASQEVVARLQSEMNDLRKKRESQTGSTIGMERERDAVASLWRSSDAIESRLIDLTAHPANPNARILTSADVPQRPAFPSKSLFALAGLILAGFTSSGYVIVKSHLYRLQLAAPQVAGYFNAPLLGGVPRVRGALAAPRRLIGSDSRGKVAMGLAATLQSVVFEIEEAVREGRIRALLISSGLAGEGKTSVAAALGRSLASVGMSVLLIDLDLRRPRAESVFQSGATGLDSRAIDLGSSTLTVKMDRSSGLQILTPYPASADPIDSLRSVKLRESIAALRQSYDLLLIDSPPLLLVPDALIAAKFADAVLLVTEFGRSDETQLEELSRRIARTGKPVHGVIVTKVEANDPVSGVYSGYGYG
jgi:polysaccharide biosynthesis transport protein